jgi:hypothetical protein
VSAYYNEHDAKTAAWLRELIKAGLIADGEVDTRSIEDVRPDELRSFTDSAISSPALADGALRFVSLDGPTIAPSGPAVVPASLSARQAKAMGLLTSGTYGLPGIGSSNSVALSSSFGEQVESPAGRAWLDLVSTDLEGLATPAGRSISLLRASGRRVSGNACSGWPTAKTPTGGANSQRDLRGAGGPDLQEVAKLSGWPTATAKDGASSGVLAYPATATHHSGTTLTDASRLSGWSHDWKDTAGMAETATNPDGSTRTRLDQLPRQAQLAAHGPTPTGSTAVTRRSGQLNPAHSRWLMGYPPAWDDCAVTAMPSTRTSPQRSSGRT